MIHIMKSMTSIISLLVFLFLETEAQQFHDTQDFIWSYLITPVRNWSQPILPPCLLRSQPVFRRDDYTYTPGIGGHKLHTRALTWNEARRTCEEEGGHLVIINSIAEANAIVDLWEKSPPITGTHRMDIAFIGFHDLWQQGEYLTIHGQTLARAGYTIWAPGQPDYYQSAERCGSLHKDGGLNDLNCNLKYGFICEAAIA